MQNLLVTILELIISSLQVLSNARLPDKECDFFTALKDYFPCFFDIKVMLPKITKTADFHSSIEFSFCTLSGAKVLP